MRWTGEEDKILLDIVFNYLRNRKSATSGIVAAYRKLPNRTLEAVKSRWNTYLKYEYEKEIKEITSTNKRSWSSREDQTLINIIYENLKNKITITRACEYASEALKADGSNRTSKACETRWKEIRYDYPHVSDMAQYVKFSRRRNEA